MAPKKRPASNMAISISGGKYIEEQGLKDLLEKALAEIEETKPANCVEFLQGLLEESGPKKAKKDEEACWTAFPSPGDAVWRQNAQQRAKSALEPFPGKVSIPCNASPGATRSFPVDPKDTALVLIDMQTDFLECTDDEGYELHPLLRAQPGEIVVDKWTYGAFASTFLERELRKKGVKRILLCGVLTNVCVFATASQAVDRFISVCLVEDACAAFTTEWHQKALSLLNDPQIQPGHERGVGLYFGEVTQVEKVEAALKDVKP
eukprot:CAMPEP_0181524362 /NCGR_PEP_ID=MMETSP1110-20121109/68391_1 /TAXON_ID=174948 /ORGANISM="Symbiodinium sp., Strain CCMP421" /LENGTH=262 /DNA_ID=CAMNT_0023655089 /DNA_START=79 /DNA_END=867 /DNA_ORIENTATION=-